MKLEAVIFDYDGTLVLLNIDFDALRREVEGRLLGPVLSLRAAPVRAPAAIYAIWRRVLRRCRANGGRRSDFAVKSFSEKHRLPERYDDHQYHRLRDVSPKVQCGTESLLAPTPAEAVRGLPASR